MRSKLPSLNECLLTAALTFTAFAAFANDARSQTVTIAKPWARATPTNAPVAGGFMTITNKGAQPDRLTGGAFDISGRVEIHEMAMANGVMTMRQVPGGLEIKPGSSVELKPGSYHIMFIGLKRQLKQGETIKGTLTFEKAGTVPIEVSVEGMGAQQAPMNH